MTCRKFSQYSKVITVCLVYMLLTFLPVICLVISGRGDIAFIVNARRIGLMINSFVIAFFTVTICMIIAVFASLWIYTEFSRMSLLRWYFLLLAPVPPYIYALSYMNLLRFMGKFFPGILRYRLAGIFPCVTVETFLYLPFACAAALIALDQMNDKEWTSALLFENADKVFFKVIFPKQLPWLLAIGAVIFVLSITEYSIPSLFQVNVYAMEIFSDYSAAGQSVHSLYLSFPLMLISAAVIILSLLPLKNISFTMKTETGIKPQYSQALKVAGMTAFFITFLQIILPLISFIPSIQEMDDDLVSASGELWNSCISGLIAVLFLSVPSAVMALYLCKKNLSFKTIVWVIAVLPLCIPGVLTGIGILKLFSSTPLYILRSGAFFPAAGLAIRYLPFAVLIQYGCYLRIDWNRIRAAELLQNRRGEAFLKVQFPLMLPGLIISGIAVFLLALGDVGTSLVLMMPGREPMSVKIYNYLHYGSSEKVTVFCLIQMVVSLVLIAGVFVFSSWFHRRSFRER